VTRALGADKVIVAVFAKPSQPIMEWYKNWQPPADWQPPAKYMAPTGDAPMYKSLISAVNQAVKNQEIESTTLVWMQGEADAGSGWGAVYEKSFEGVLDQLRADLNQKQISFVVGRINDFWLTSKGVKDGDMMRTLLVKMAESHSNGAWIDTDDLNTGVNPWGTYDPDGGHFPPEGYMVMGQRFARKALKLAAPAAVIDEACFDARFIDDTKSIKSHAAIGKTITGTTPDEKNAGVKSGLNTLLDGHFGSPEFTDSAWLGFPPSDKPVEFNIDLGAVADITAIAVNLLINLKGKSHFPGSIALSVSKDGSSYSDLTRRGSAAVSFGKLSAVDKNSTPKSTLIFYGTSKIEARYVKVKVLRESASDAWLFLDEILINPVVR